jgi:hypothetical protein
VPGFPSPGEERRHIRRHFIDQNEFGVASAGEYVALAFAFSEADDWPIGLEECRRVCDKKFARFVEACGWFAVMREDRSQLLTFHVLQPAGTPGALRPHSYTTNREYVFKDCGCER